MSTNTKYCSICRQKYLFSSLFSCYNNHYFCRDCYRQKLNSGVPKRCPHRYCESWICTSGSPREIGEDDHGEPREPKKMFPVPEAISLEKAEREEKQKSSVGHLSNMSTASLSVLSKKPVSCPFRNCNKSIAVTSFDAHFKYEHKNVFVINTHLEHRNGLQFCPDDVIYNEKLCFVLINILDEDIAEEVKKFEQKCREQGFGFARPIFVLLATRYSAANLEDSDDEEEEIDDDQFACSPDDKIIMWLASTVLTGYSYTLAISTLCNGIRIKYYGPVLTLNEDSKKLCNEGHCLVLSQNHFTGMSENGQIALTVDVVIHGIDDDD